MSPSDANEALVLNNIGIQPPDYGSFLQTYFDTYSLDTSTPTELLDDIDQNNLVLGIWNNSDGTSSHQVVIVSCDVGGTVEYYDPEDGYYGKTSYEDFNVLVEVTPKESN